MSSTSEAGLAVRTGTVDFEGHQTWARVTGELDPAGERAPLVVLADSAGIASLSICNSPASMPLWVEAANRLLADLPTDVQRTLTEHEAAGTTDSPEYHQAMDVLYARHMPHVEEPEEFRRVVGYVLRRHD